LNQTALNPTGLLHLLVVYLVWGSTYLGFRVALGPQGQFDPYWLAALRFLAAGSLLLLYTRWRLGPLRLTWRQAAGLALSGTVLWVGGNLLVTMATQGAESGYVALLVSSTPLWVALIEAGLSRQLPSAALLGSLTVGLAGIAVLSWPRLAHASEPSALPMVLALCGAATWGLGTLITRRQAWSLDPIRVAGYQQFFAGLVALPMATLLGQWQTPTATGWLAWGYLLGVASLIASVSYLIALKLLPTRLVTTYAYVNPIVAVVLGWWILDEPLSLYTAAGSLLVILSVAGVFRSRR
jgi:drug/metabolite transporter (DMT)-like permease